MAQAGGRNQRVGIMVAWRCGQLFHRIAVEQPKTSVEVRPGPYLTRTPSRTRQVQARIDLDKYAAPFGRLEWPDCHVAASGAQCPQHPHAGESPFADLFCA